MKRPIFVSLTILALATLACSLGMAGCAEDKTMNELQAEFGTLPAGDAARGEQTFLAKPCHVCHADQSIGPAFPGDPPLSVRAATRESGTSAELYLYESIVEPNAYLVPGFQKDVMPADVGKDLTDQELADLIAYLMTMK